MPLEQLQALAKELGITAKAIKNAKTNKDLALLVLDAEAVIGAKTAPQQEKAPRQRKPRTPRAAKPLPEAEKATEPSDKKAAETAEKKASETADKKPDKPWRGGENPPRFGCLKLNIKILRIDIK